MLEDIRSHVVRKVASDALECLCACHDSQFFSAWDEAYIVDEAILVDEFLCLKGVDIHAIYGSFQGRTLAEVLGLHSEYDVLSILGDVHHPYIIVIICEWLHETCSEIHLGKAGAVAPSWLTVLRVDDFIYAVFLVRTFHYL